MEKSTIVGIGLLAVVGVGAYVYLKGKKSPIVSTTATSTQTASPTDDTKLLQDLGVKIEEPKVTPYVKPIEGVPLLTAENLQKALLALGIDQTRGITELSSPNYIEAKRIAGNMSKIPSGVTYRKNPQEIESWRKLSEQNIKIISLFGGIAPNTDQIKAVMTKRINALGYKVLPNYDIEKM